MGELRKIPPIILVVGGTFGTFSLFRPTTGRTEEHGGSDLGLCNLKGALSAGEKVSGTFSSDWFLLFSGLGQVYSQPILDLGDANKFHDQPPLWNYGHKYSHNSRLRQNRQDPSAASPAPLPKSSLSPFPQRDLR